MLKKSVAIITSWVILLFASASVSAQADEFCTEFGSIPSLNSPFAQIPYVFGRISLKGFDQAAKWPKITVTLVDRENAERRLTVERKGNYCFRRTANSSATLIVEIDGVEASRRSLAAFGATQQREDFEIFPKMEDTCATPATVSARYYHPQNDKTTELYKKAADAEKAKNNKAVIGYLKEIVAIDPVDFLAWGKLGYFQTEEKAYADAEASLRRSLALKPEYLPAWHNASRIRVANKQYESAVEVLKHAVTLDEKCARTFQLLGEAYLYAKQGSLGADALNQAIKLDPQGMAECHLQLAHLYQLAGAKQMAAKEYKLFLEKVPEHKDRGKFEKFIKENP